MGSPQMRCQFLVNQSIRLNEYVCTYTIIYPEKVRYEVIGVEMKGMESSMKLVALGAKVRQVW